MVIEPKISVITACHNHGKFILEMIDSVLEQTFQDFEMIIVNDGSVDDTKKILDSLKNSKIHVIHSGNNGPSIARNTAVHEAKASIILNLDADDKIAPDFLEKAYKVFCNNPQAGIVFTKCRYFGSRSGEAKSQNFSLRNMLIENRIASTAFFRKEDWQKTGGYSEAFIYGREDWDFWLSILELEREIVKIPDSYVFYRKYRNITHCRSGKCKTDREKQFYTLNKIFSRHEKLYSLFPDIYFKFSKYKRIPETELVILKLYNDAWFYFKQRLSYQFR